jgi:hypothetical protein
VDCSGTCVAESKDHCGRCNQSCEGTSCTNGKCAAGALEYGGTEPRSIVVSTSAVYWLDLSESDPRVFSAPLDGTGVGPLFTQVGYPTLNQIAVAGDRVCGLTTDTVLVQPAAGTDPMEERQQVPSGNLTGIAADLAAIYWIDQAPTPRVLQSVPVDGGAAPLTDMKDNLQDVAVDETHVYWANTEMIWAKPKAGGNTISISRADTVQLAASGGKVCAISQVLTGAVFCASASDGATLMTITNPQSLPIAVAVAGDYVYWTDQSSKLNRARIETDATEQDLGDAPPATKSIAVHEEGSRHRVFMAGDNGNVMKLVVWN